MQNVTAAHPCAHQLDKKMNPDYQSFGNLIVVLLYVALGVGVWVIESAEFRRRGFGIHQIVLSFFFIYVIFPSAVMHAVLAYDTTISTGVGFFDRTVGSIEFQHSLIVFFLNFIFIKFFYFAKWMLYPERAEHSARADKRVVRFNEATLWSFIGIGAVVCLCFFYGLGTNFSERYSALILFRNLSDGSDRNFFTANAFSITQTFSWLCAGLSFYYIAGRKMKMAVLSLLLCLMFSFLMGSRRGFVFPILILYFCSALYYGRLYFWRVFSIIPLVVAWVAVGKELTGSFAYSSGGYSVDAMYASYLGALLRSACDIGITQVQSYAVFQNFDLSFRLGFDHILSLLRLLPEGVLGFPDLFPERITRITTTTFESLDAADIPPGLIGASWLDFPILGAAAWGAGIAYMCWVVNVFRNGHVKTPALIVCTVIFAIIVAMPINTGSFDFTFTVDIFVLMCVLLFSIRRDSNFG